MSLRHVVLMHHTPEADLDALRAGLEALPSKIEHIKGYEVLVDAGLQDGNAQAGVIGLFDDEAGFRAYLAHPAHVEVVERLIAPFRTDRLAIQMFREG
jgi:hypothetical protein